MNADNHDEDDSKHRKPFQILIILISATLFFSMFVTMFLYVQESDLLTGKVVSHEARGGYVTQIDLSQEAYTFWEGYYGNLTANTTQYYCGMTLNTDQTNLSMHGTTNISELFLGLNKCFNTEIYITTSEAHMNTTVYPILAGRNYLNGMTAATGTELDAYYDFDKSKSAYPRISVVSGTITFPSSVTSTFEVGDNNLTIPTQKMNSVLGEYKLGILKDAYGNVVFVVNIESGRLSFSGTPSDFEFMLPVSPLRTLRYYFFQDPTDDCGFPAGLGPYDAVPGTPTLIDIKDEVDVSLVVNVITPTNVSFAVTNTFNTPICAYNPSEEGKIALDKFIYINPSKPTMDNQNYTEIRIHYEAAEFFYKDIYEETLRLYRWNSTFYTWDLLEISGVDTNNNYVWGITKEFGLFAIVGSNTTIIVIPPSNETQPRSSDGGGGGGGVFIDQTEENISSCTENWICSQWSPCRENGVQERTCFEANNCTTALLKPETLQLCLYNPRIEKPVLERPDLILVERSELFSLKASRVFDNLTRITPQDAGWRINKYSVLFLWIFIIAAASMILLIIYIDLKRPILEVGREKEYERKLPKWRVLKIIMITLILLLIISTILFIYYVKVKQDHYINLNVEFSDEGLFTKEVFMAVKSALINKEHQLKLEQSKELLIKNGTKEYFKLNLPLFLNQDIYEIMISASYSDFEWGDKQQVLVENLKIPLEWYLIYSLIILLFAVTLYTNIYYKRKLMKEKLKRE